MHDRNGGGGAFVLKVEIVGADLIGEEQTLVHHGAGRHGGNEVFGAVFQIKTPDIVARGLSDDVELSLERILHHDVRAASDENLTDYRFFCPDGGTHRHVTVDRHVTPAENHLTVGAHRAFEVLFAGRPRCAFLRQENHPHAVVAGRRKRHALGGHFLPVVGIGNLDQNACAVAAERIGAHGAAMIEIVKNEKGILNGLVRFSAADVGDETDAAGVLLVCRLIQAVRLRGGRPLVGHALSPAVFCPRGEECADRAPFPREKGDVS